MLWDEKNLGPKMKNDNLTANGECDTTGSTPTMNDARDLSVITREKASGIYKIINKVNGKYYVGSSVNLVEGHRGRWYEHKKMLRIGKHYNSHLQRSWTKHGEDNFCFEIIERVDKDNLHVVEQKYLDIAKCEKDKVYNNKFYVTYGKYGRVTLDETKEKLRIINTGKRASEETRNKMSLSSRGIQRPWQRGRKTSDRPIIQVDKNGNFIREFPSSIIATKELGIIPSSLSMVCNGKRKHTHGYFFKFK